MNSNPIICELCKNVFETPIVLPCGDTICFKHASTDEFNCPFCKEVHQKPNKGYPENRKLKMLTDKFEKAKNMLNLLHSNVQLIKKFKENGGDFFKNELTKVKDQIFAKKEQTKKLVNDMIESNYSELIREVETHQKVLNKIMVDKDNISENELNKIETEVRNWKADLEAIKISENIWEQIENQYTDTSNKLESFKFGLNKSVNQFVQDKICIFKERDLKIDKIELGEIISENRNVEMDTSSSEPQEEEEEEKAEQRQNDILNNEICETNFEKQVRIRGHLKSVNCIKFDRSGKFIITGADNIKIWRACDGLLVCSLKGPSNVLDFDISYENNCLVSVYNDSNLFLFNLNEPRLISVQNGPFDNYSVKFSPMVCRNNSRWIVSTSNKNSICFWKMNSETFEFSSYPIKFIEKTPSSNYINRISFSRGGVFAAVSYEDSRIHVFYINDVNVTKISDIKDLKAKISSIQFSNSSLKFISCYKDSTSALWTCSSKKWTSFPIQKIEQSETNPNEDVENFSKWTCDDKKMVSTINNNGLYLINVWDVTSREPEIIHKLDSHRDKIIALEPNPVDPNILLSCSKNGHLYVWDLLEGIRIHRFINLLAIDKRVSAYTTISWSPSGESFTSGDLKGGMSIFSKDRNDNFRRFNEQFFMSDFENEKINFNEINDETNSKVITQIINQNLVDSGKNAFEVNDLNKSDGLKIKAVTGDSLSTYVSIKFSHRLEEKLVYDKEFKITKTEEDKENVETKKATKRSLKSDIGIKNRNSGDNNTVANDGSDGHLNEPKRQKKNSLDGNTKIELAKKTEESQVKKTKTPPKNQPKPASKNEKSTKLPKKRSSDECLVDLDF